MALQWSIAGDSYALGIDNDNDDKFTLAYAAVAGTAVLGTNNLLEIQGDGVAFEPTFKFISGQTDQQVAVFDTLASNTTTNTLWSYNGDNQASIQTRATECNFWLLDKDFGSGITGPQFRIGRNSNGTGSAGSLRLTDKSGTHYYFWVDDSGTLRVNTSAPTNATDTGGSPV